MFVTWDANEVNNPTEQGLDAASNLPTATVTGTDIHVPTNELVVTVRRHLDGNVVRVMKTIANAGKVDIYVDLPMEG